MVNTNRLKLAIVVLLLGIISIGYGGICNFTSTETKDNTGSSSQPNYRAPVFVQIGSKTVSEGALILFAISGTDPDGDALTYSAYNVPAGAAFDAATHTFSWAPTYNQSGAYSVRFRVTDSVGLYAEEIVSITVTDVSPSTAPGNLTAQVVTASQINLSWQDNSADETGFNIEQKISATGTYTQIGIVNANVTAYSSLGLSGGQLYYYRVRSYNSSGYSSYSNEISVATTALSIAPTIINNYLTNISPNTATFYGILNPNGLATTAYFEYGTSTAYGTSTTSSALGNGTTSANTSADISALQPSTTYHFRLVTTNSSGTSYGQDQTFITPVLMTPPSATTGSASNILYNAATISGVVNPNGFTASVYFQLGTTTSYGRASAEQSIGSGMSNVSVSATISGLMPETTYHFRLVANNSSNSIPGADQTFTTSAAPTGDVSGTILDADGQPLEGAMVVLGQNSPHSVTDHEGKFTITGVPIGSQPINVIAGGFYTLNQTSVSVDVSSTTATATDLGNIQIKEVGEGLDNAPHIENVNAVISGNIISVSATITKGAGNDEVTDARAELLYYNTGCVLTNTNGNQYSGTITIPANAVGPNLTVVIFAVDEQNMTANESVTVSYSGGSSTGNFTLDTVAGQWSGSLKYHRDDIDDNNNKRALREWTNAELTISGTAVAGRYAEPRLWLVKQGRADPIETVNLDSGNVTLVDASVGLYKIELSLTGLSRTVSVVLMAKCDSSANPTNLFGIIHISEITDFNSITVTNRFAGRFHFKKGAAWALSDLSSSWVLSDFFGAGPALDARYTPPFQYNEALTLDAAGNVTTGTNTMGLSITNGGFSINDAGLGKFVGVITTSDNATTYFYGLVDLGKKHIKGVKKITLGTSRVYGHFWGPKTPVTHFNISDFASRRISGITVNSVFAGYIRVTAGPNVGNSYPVKLHFDASGNVVAGFVFPSITATSTGSVSFTNTTTGQFVGSVTGQGYTFTIAPAASPRNASMGVYKARLVGDFTLGVSGGTNSGFFFMHRRPEPLTTTP